MTALNFRLQEDHVVVTADSLARLVGDGVAQESHWQSKIVVVPHSAVILCGDGDMSVFAEWAKAILFHAHVRGVDSVHTVSPRLLGEIDEEVGFGDSTLFAFGFSQAQGKLVGYRYETEASFAGAEIEPGIRLMPTDSTRQEQWVEMVDSWFPGVLDVVKEQRTFDEKLKGHQSIGGPIHTAIIESREPHCVNTLRHDVFPDDDAAYARMQGPELSG